MFKSYLKIAWRSIVKNKSSSIINITGLTVGLTCCFLIALYVRHELSYDNFQEKGDRLARVVMEYKIGSDGRSGIFTSTKVFPALKRNFPEVESGIRMDQGTKLVKYGDKLFSEKRFMHADSTFFDLFSFKLLAGSPKKVLEAPFSVVLTQDAAKRYFGSENPVGKTIQVGSDAKDYQVTGIVENCPTNSQIKFDMVASFSSYGPAQERTYWNANYTTYLLLKDEAAIRSLEAKIPAFMKKEMSDQPGSYVNFTLEPFKTVHLHSPHDGFEPGVNVTYIYILSGIAVLILSIACFTYINLSTARSIERAREVGIRKVSGALKNQLFWQFIGESAMLSFMSLALSIGIGLLVLPYFNHLSDRSFAASQLLEPGLLSIGLGIVVVISLFAGSYPALILSRFQPVAVLKGAFKNTGSGVMLRKSLTVFQFVISVFLIVATFTIQNQLRYIRNKNLGFDRNQIVVLPFDGMMMKNTELIKTEMKKYTGVKSVSLTYNTPNNIVGGYSMKNGMMPGASYVSVTANPIDEDFIKTSGMHLIAGSDLSQQDLKDVASEDSTAVFHFVINESAATALGWKPQEAIGKKLSLGDDRPGFIKGVVKDFHFQSLHTSIKPLVLFPGSWFNNMMVKLDGNELAKTVTSLESTWKTIAPHRPFEYKFLDEEFNKMYQSELRTGEILNVFAGMAIILACLGLFGLSSYAAQQRVKEIGIRKILGASVLNLTTILSKDFVKLALVAFVIAAPLAGWAMSNWLQQFSYRVSLSAWIFGGAGIACMLIAVVTVSIQAIRVALDNPVKNLKAD